MPTIRPRIPKSTKDMFFATIIDLSVLSHTVQNVQIWMIAGNANPRPERHRAPNSDMKRSNWGIATANRTVRNGQKTGLIDVLLSCFV